MDKPVDIVIPWVDSSDVDWQKSYAEYSESRDILMNGKERFRDYGTLKFLFRSIDKYAPWVNKVYLITNGQLPNWINLNNPKLVCIKHVDYIDKKFLPTFNANVIEGNVYKIKTLSDNFVLFNDDMIINNLTSKSDFFLKGKPRDSAVMSPVFPTITGIDNMVVNDLAIINKYFNKNVSIKKHIFNFFNVRYGAGNIKNLLLSPYSAYCGFYDYHIPYSYNKKTFEKVYSLSEIDSNKLFAHRFRTSDDVNDWIVRYWQLSSGEFIPRNTNFGKYFSIDNIKEISKVLNEKKIKVICLNDKNIGESFNKTVVHLESLLLKKFHEKSSYES